MWLNCDRKFYAAGQIGLQTQLFSPLLEEANLRSPPVDGRTENVWTAIGLLWFGQVIHPTSLTMSFDRSRSFGSGAPKMP